MREIKFRCWQVFDEDEEGNPKWQMLDADELAFENYEPLKDLLVNDPDSEIFMQYTGLLDKLGKEIYEGDQVISETISIFNDSDIIKIPAIVVWIGEIACFGLELNGRRVGLYDTLLGWDSSVFEVIGNIYENPELLK